MSAPRPRRVVLLVALVATLGLLCCGGSVAALIKNAAIIIKTGSDLKLPPRAWVIAIATAMQESGLRNLDTAVDHDSLGLFQQRPSTGWGSPAQILYNVYAST